MSDCIQWWGSFHSNGQGQAWERLTRRKITAHRLAWLECFGEIPAGMCVIHRCSNTGCVNPEHLMLGTHAENTHQMVARGRCKRSGQAAKALTAETAFQVRRLYHDGWSIRDLSEGFGLHPGRVWRIVNNKTWKHASSKAT